MKRVFSVLCLVSVVALLCGPVLATTAPIYNLTFDGADPMTNIGSAGGVASNYIVGEGGVAPAFSTTVTHSPTTSLDLRVDQSRIKMPGNGTQFTMFTTGDEMTVAGWFYFDGAKADRVLVDKKTTNAGNGWALQVDTGYGWRFQANSVNNDNNSWGGGWWTTTGVALPTLNAWNHIALTWKAGTDATVYLNGVGASFGAVGPTKTLNNYPIGVGAGQPYAFQGMKGYVDNFQMYDQVLTGAEIINVMNTGAPNVAPVPEPITMSLVGMGIVGLGGYIRRRMKVAQ